MIEPRDAFGMGFALGAAVVYFGLAISAAWERLSGRRKARMKLFLFAAMLAVIGCGDSTGPSDPLPFFLPGEGQVRFQLGNNCPTLTLRFGIGADDFNGPETLSAGGTQGYSVSAGVQPTWARTMDDSRSFPRENVTVIAGERVTRVLAC